MSLAEDQTITAKEDNQLSCTIYSPSFSSGTSENYRKACNGTGKSCPLPSTENAVFWTHLSWKYVYHFVNTALPCATESQFAEFVLLRKPITWFA